MTNRYDRKFWLLLAAPALLLLLSWRLHTQTRVPSCKVPSQAK